MLVTMTDAAEAVLRLWRSLGSKDWLAVAAIVSDDCIFVDVPLGPTLAARGPDDVVKRLRGGLENPLLAAWSNRDVQILTNGVDVMYEHVITYTSTSGQTADNPIVSIHRVRDGEIVLWKDYCDFATFSGMDWFRHSVVEPDMTWVFDATGLV